MKKVCCQWDGRRPISRKNKRIPAVIGGWSRETVAGWGGVTAQVTFPLENLLIKSQEEGLS